MISGDLKNQHIAAAANASFRACSVRSAVYSTYRSQRRSTFISARGESCLLSQDFALVAAKKGCAERAASESVPVDATMVSARSMTSALYGWLCLCVASCRDYRSGVLTVSSCDRRLTIFRRLSLIS